MHGNERSAPLVQITMCSKQQKTHFFGGRAQALGLFKAAAIVQGLRPIATNQPCTLFLTVDNYGRLPAKW